VDVALQVQCYNIINVYEKRFWVETACQSGICYTILIILLLVKKKNVYTYMVFDQTVEILNIYQV